MNLTDILNESVKEAFLKAGFDETFAKVSPSNRPDLCEYQCNGAMALAKTEHRPPIAIAEEIVSYLKENGVFSHVEALAPGFINLTVSTAFLARFTSSMADSERFLVRTEEKPKTVIVDYGGPNVAKPLHIGHLRSAIIGESVKRIIRYMGNHVIGDIHLGDWGTPIGLIIEELKERKPELCYFKEDYRGSFPDEAPFTVGELEEIYPAASAKSKIDEAFRERALSNTARLQKRDPAFLAIWEQIMKVSVADLKKNYEKLNVSFELWKAESDADPYIPEMIEDLKKRGIAHKSEGALVIDVSREDDKREVPPCLIQKSDGASLYATTDLATVVYRMKDYHPDEMIYLADKRQEMHYTQFFRASRKADYVKPETRLEFIGFGTMNGKDGKPFKTRSGGVMRLEALISEIEEAVYEKMKNRYDESELSSETVKKVALSAIKYGDLSNQARKDYNFDIDRFASFEGNTGPYILYNIVRIKSILKKAGDESGEKADFSNLPFEAPGMKTLLLKLCGFPDMMEEAYLELAPHRICQYIHELSDAFSSFYHDTPILKEENEATRRSLLILLKLIEDILETCIDLLGFSAPDKM